MTQLAAFEGLTIRDLPVNVAKVPHRSPFRYPGGKTWFVPYFRSWIKAQHKKPKLLIDPFVGGGIIPLTAVFENLVESIIIGEIDPNVASVWQTMLGPNAHRFADDIRAFVVTREAVERLLALEPKDTYDRAFQTILRNRMCHGGIMAPGAGLLNEGESGKGLMSRWYPETLARRITDIARIANRIEFRRADAFEILKNCRDVARAAWFIDPPYTAGGKSAGKRLYNHHSLNHKELFGMVSRLKGPAIMTYDVAKEVEELAAMYGMSIDRIPMKNTHHAVMYEYVVTNRKQLRR